MKFDVIRGKLGSFTEIPWILNDLRKVIQLSQLAENFRKILSKIFPSGFRFYLTY